MVFIYSNQYKNLAVVTYFLQYQLYAHSSSKDIPVFVGLNLFIESVSCWLKYSWYWISPIRKIMVQCYLETGSLG